ncbi:transmembrane protein 218 isoform X2 [Caloenas nicobarica]|uniref:transmembrane protein 218 isoform X2 n=1 Tax=Caloenas nicobarica TaxID=187106 RepID=UPI0032B76EA0
MAGTVLGVGPGVLALQLLWGLALLLCLGLTRAAGRARFAVVPVALGAAALSAALLLFPREDERPAAAAAEEVGSETKSSVFAPGRPTEMESLFYFFPIFNWTGPARTINNT